MFSRGITGLCPVLSRVLPYEDLLCVVYGIHTHTRNVCKLRTLTPITGNLIGSVRHWNTTRGAAIIVVTIPGARYVLLALNPLSAQPTHNSMIRTDPLHKLNVDGMFFLRLPCWGVQWGGVRQGEYWHLIQRWTKLGKRLRGVWLGFLIDHLEENGTHVIITVPREYAFKFSLFILHDFSFASLFVSIPSLLSLCR